LARIARYLNGFIVIGLVLVVIGIAGLATENRLLTEPGQPVNPYSWLLYLGAAAIMLVNGMVSIKHASRSANADDAPANGEAGGSARKSETA
jgi:hypothetical protein